MNRCQAIADALREANNRCNETIATLAADLFVLCAEGFTAVRAAKKLALTIAMWPKSTRRPNWSSRAMYLDRWQVNG